MKTRTVYVDLLRIFAAFMVIFLHVSASNWYVTDVRGIEWQTFNFYDSLVRSAVPLFVMISGMFLLQPKKPLTIQKIWTQNILRLVTAYLFWSFVYVVYVFVRQDKVWDGQTLIWAVETLIKGHYHLWYIPMLIGLYILTPMLRLVTEKEDKRLMEYLLLLFFMFGIAKKTILLFDIPSVLRLALTEVPMEAFVGYMGYYLLGYYLYTYHVPKAVRIASYLLGILSVGVTTFTSLHFAYLTNEPSSKLYDYLVLPTFFEAVAILLFFKYVISKWTPSEGVTKWVNRLSGYTFGIYLVHILFIRETTNAGLTTLSFHPILSVPVISVIVFVLSLAVAFLISRIKGVSKYIG